MTMPDKVYRIDDGNRSARIRFILMILIGVSLIRRVDHNEFF